MVQAGLVLFFWLIVISFGLGVFFPPLGAIVFMIGLICIFAGLAGSRHPMQNSKESEGKGFWSRLMDSIVFNPRG